MKSIGEYLEEKEVKEINFEELQVKRFNECKVKDDVYDCPKCGNKGLIAYINDEGKLDYKRCDCYVARINRRKLKNMGLLSSIETAKSPFKGKNDNLLKLTKGKVKDYCEKLSDDNNNWFYIGGKNGSGKTTRCASILNYIMTKFPYAEVEYFLWDSRYKELTFAKDKDYLLRDLQTVDVLYLDDFFRLTNGHQLTDIERDPAKAIIDYRYRNNLITIISSELYLTEIIKQDEAIGSRIKQRCGKYIIGIDKSKEENNLRLTETEENLI